MDPVLPDRIAEILVVCTGNICRSPMASAALRAALTRAGVRGIMVSSAGTAAQEGLPASPEAIETAEEHGLDISHHRSRALTPAALRRADLVLTMTETHRESVLALDPDAAHKTFLLGRWRRDAANGTQISDPYGMPYSYYQYVFGKIERAVDDLVKTLVRERAHG